MTDSRTRWRGFLLSLALGLVGVLLLLQLAATDPQQIDTFSPQFIGILIGLSLAIFAAVLFLIREAVRRVWLIGVRQMRAQALEEHHRFLRRLDHELKNPLTAMRAGLASLALTLNEDQHRVILATLSQDADRITRLIYNLRKLAEIDVVPLDIQPIEVGMFCQQVLDLFNEQRARYDRKCRVETLQNAQTLPPLIGDPDLLLLVAHNLLDNAFKYTRDGDLIILRFRVEEGDFIMAVEDSGIGIPPQEQLHVWEELYRGTNVSTIEGSGIGLAMVRAIVERHFGTLHLTSQLNKGTTFAVHIPLT